MSISGQMLLFLLVFAWITPVNAQVVPESDMDRAELLSWLDAPSALQLLDKLQTTALSGDELVRWLMIRGLADVNVEPTQVDAIIRRLQELGAARSPAEAASHIIRAYLYIHSEQFDRAEAELERIGADVGLPAFVRYRLEVLRGEAQERQNRYEVALSSHERLYDLANTMHSASRVFEAMTKLCALYLQTGNLDRATALVAQMRALARQTGDELQWFEASDIEGEIANARGDRLTQQRMLLEALRHARLAGSDRSMAIVLIDLGDIYSKTGSYAISLSYSVQALTVARKLHRALFERIATFNMGIAHIGLRHLAQGKQLAENAINEFRANSDFLGEHRLMRDYVPALEKSGDLRGALEVSHRDQQVREQLAATARQKVILELSAKFDDERRMRRIQLLERDNAIKSRGLQAQRLRQQMIVMVGALIAVVCGALAWGIAQIRKVNTRWVHNSQRDALTGLFNRRYCNEHIVARHGNRPYVGCLLLIDVDYFQHINDTLGHAAGDGLLAAIGKRLSSTLRGSDVLVRWAGEEFLAILGPMSAAQLSLLAHQLLVTMRGEPVSWNGKSHRCTISIGYASFPMSGAAVGISLERAITLVGKALNQAKRQGRDRACLIEVINASSEQELSTINARFEEAAADSRVQLVEVHG